jgi:hypothetical protein
LQREEIDRDLRTQKAKLQELKEEAESEERKRKQKLQDQVCRDNWERQQRLLQQKQNTAQAKNRENLLNFGMWLARLVGFEVVHYQENHQD